MFAIAACLLPVVICGPAASEASAQGPSSASAPLRLRYLGDEIVLRLLVGATPPKLCRGERIIFAVGVYKYRVYEDGGARRNVPRSSPRRTQMSLNNITGVVAASSNASVLRMTSQGNRMGNDILIFYANFVAGEAGSATITFSYRDPDGNSPDPLTVTVQVTECDYQAEIVSVWHVNVNRNVLALATIQTTLHSQGDSLATRNSYSATATVENLAWSPPIGGCAGVEATSEGQAALTGELRGLAGDKPFLELKVEYSGTGVDTTAVCPQNNRPMADDPARAQTLLFTELDPGGANVCEHNHVLDAPGLGTFTGPGCILLVKINR